MRNIREIKDKKTLLEKYGLEFCRALFKKYANVRSWLPCDEKAGYGEIIDEIHENGPADDVHIAIVNYCMERIKDNDQYID